VGPKAASFSTGAYGWGQQQETFHQTSIGHSRTSIHRGQHMPGAKLGVHSQPYCLDMHTCSAWLRRKFIGNSLPVKSMGGSGAHIWPKFHIVPIQTRKNPKRTCKKRPRCVWGCCTPSHNLSVVCWSSGNDAPHGSRLKQLAAIQDGHTTQQLHGKDSKTASITTGRGTTAPPVV
jgi:hypothetical protein